MAAERDPAKTAAELELAEAFARLRSGLTRDPVRDRR